MQIKTAKAIVWVWQLKNTVKIIIKTYFIPLIILLTVGLSYENKFI